MPQQNGIVEHAFPSLMGHTKAMMNYAGFDKSMHQFMWCKAANTATVLDRIIVPSDGNKCSYELFYGKTHHYIERLCTSGEIALMKDPANISTKLDLCGRVCMFVGYSEDHTEKVHRFLNLSRKKVVYSQDVQWMDVMYGEHMDIKCKIQVNQD